uniref:V-set and immunoglobulin domain-containing protein 1-like n=1 Tax=Callorhinchus milii TaxID=7868 RepID=A0A4W3IM42_CALMI|eukprot:gi/632982380/ref/XP_007908103.1/ PREDICTED: V-set and immunoglobulin domain-containing protein 1-like isoform X1 [Callorhinchus milii]
MSIPGTFLLVILASASFSSQDGALITAAEGREMRLVYAFNSSVLLLGFTEEDLIDKNIIQWHFSKADISLPILDYYIKSKTLTKTELYKNRVDFNESNGSILLRHLQISDSGKYQIKVNLENSMEKIIHLEVFVPLSNPFIVVNSSYVGTTVELSCKVLMGEATDIYWMKEEQKLFGDDRLRLMDDNRSLVIAEAEKWDCGIYTCVMGNSLGQTNHSYHLVIYGLTISHKVILAGSAIAFLCALMSFTGIAFLCNQSNKEQLDIKVQNKIFFTHHTLAISSLIALICAFIFQLKVSGPSAIILVPLVIIIVVIIIVTISTLEITKCCMKHFTNIRKNNIFRVLKDVAVPFSDLLTIAISLVLLIEIFKTADKGCSLKADIQNIVAPVAIIFSLIALTLIVFFGLYNKRQNRNNDAEDQNGEEVVCLQA